ncbi:hypothetical protein VP01_2913g3 [Puccinia sorghi]|uniref:Uncharacterized protein n=1 Tax=Puccinia sorghi TaxID=27349 RepID=A0A0L6V1E1_9BASI|nr:hypothetical protein VP01_2913g3 [Puccinia sorghi]
MHMQFQNLHANSIANPATNCHYCTTTHLELQIILMSKSSRNPNHLKLQSRNPNHLKLQIISKHSKVQQKNGLQALPMQSMPNLFYNLNKWQNNTWKSSPLTTLSNLEEALPSSSQISKQSLASNHSSSNPHNTSNSERESVDAKSEVESIRKSPTLLPFFVVSAKKTAELLVIVLFLSSRHFASQTITKFLRLYPQLEKHIFCPKCSTLYKPEDAPTTCLDCKSAKAQIYGEEIFKHLKNMPHSEYQAVSYSCNYKPPPTCHFTPHLMYHTQEFSSWLKWFLNAPGVESAIDSWKEKLLNMGQEKVVQEQNMTYFFIESMGVMALTCLDLPVQTRNKHRNIFIAGIIPAPHKPDMTTISHILSPLIDELLLLHHGIYIKTPQFPNGRKVSAHLGVLIGMLSRLTRFLDLPLTQQDFSALGLSAKRRISLICNLVSGKIDLHNRENYLSSTAHNGPNSTNCLTGIQSRMVSWVFEPVPSKQETHNHLLDDQSTFSILTITDDWEDEDNKSFESSTDFQNTALLHIQKAIPEIIVPRGLTQNPANLGDPKHGKLRASEWHSLFATYLPLSLINYFEDTTASDQASTHQNQILNLTSLEDCEHFAQAYLLYNKSEKVVFQSSKIVPNHHYALHIPEQMMWWGPLSSVEEFVGEQINGTLQRMKTNGIIGQVEVTVIKEFCQLSVRQNKKIGSSWPKLTPQSTRFFCENSSLRIRVWPTISRQAIRLVLVCLVFLFMKKSNSKPRLVFTSANRHKTSWLNTKRKGEKGMGDSHLYTDSPSEDGLVILAGFKQTLNDLQLKIVAEHGSYEILDPSEFSAVCSYWRLPAWSLKHCRPLIVLRPIPHDSNLLHPSCA